MSPACKLDPFTATADQYLQLAPSYGLPASNFALSFRAQAATVATRNPPKNPQSVHYHGKTFSIISLSTACLIARGIIYWRDNCVPCAKPGTLDFENARITGEAGQLASMGVEIGASFSKGIASMAGSILPGIGIAVDAIAGIFRHHALAVKREQDTICAVAGVMNQVFAYYDAQVRNGAISPSTAYRGIQAYIAQVNEQLGAITTTSPCNEGCIMQAILAAHADFVESYYPVIAPVQITPHAPGASPSSFGTTPGGVVQVGTQTPPLIIAGMPISSGALFAILTVIVVILVVGFGVDT